MILPDKCDYNVWLSSNKGARIRLLTSFESGSLNWNSYRTVTGGGSITLAGEDQTIPWANRTIEIERVEEYGSTKKIHPLGKWLVDSHKRAFKNNTVYDTLSLVDRSALLGTIPVSETVSFPAGTNVVDAVGDMIRSYGGFSIGILPSTYTLSKAKSWTSQDAASLLTVANQLLDEIGYSDLSVDLNGSWYSGPNILFEDRLTTHSFAESLFYTDNINQEFNYLNVPNRVIVVSRGSDSEDPIVGIAEDCCSSSPFSFINRGRWVVREYQWSVSNIFVAERLANRALEDTRSVVFRQTLEHPFIPELHLDAVAEDAEGIRSIVVQRDIPLSYDKLVKTTFRRQIGVE